MFYFLFFLSFSVALLSLILCYYAHARIAKLIQSTKDLDWSALSNITGDLATVKKTIQTLNNRLNGMHSPKVADEEIMRYMANRQVAAQQNTNNNKIIGG
mgnify:FL=1|jgi:hypothetical protein